GPRADHDRDRRRASVLLRRGLPPAVPGEEPGRILWSRRHRRVVCDGRFALKPRYPAPDAPVLVRFRFHLQLRRGTSCRRSVRRRGTGGGVQDVSARRDLQRAETACNPPPVPRVRKNTSLYYIHFLTY